MRDRFEVIYIDPRGAEQVLSYTVPNGYAGRWKTVKKLASRVLPPPVRETRENPNGLTFVVESVPYPEAGVVGIRDRR